MKRYKKPTVLRAFYSYTNMRTRCENAKYRDFHLYGGRGVKVCKEWVYGRKGLTGFKTFLEDMGPQKKGMTLERVDNDKGYTPKNCIWASRAVQARNRKSTIFIETKWGVLCVKDAAKKAGLPYTTVKHRLDRGWSADEALSKVRHTRKKRSDRDEKTT